MTTPYGQQPPGQQPPSGEQPSPFGGQPQSSPFGQQAQQSPFGQAPGDQPPFGQAQQAPFGQVNPSRPHPNAYAHWGKRLGAMLIDLSPVLVIDIIGGLLFLVSDAAANAVLGIGGIAFLGFTIWNRWILMGKTGQSLGKRYLKIKLVKETTGQPLGVGMTIAREFCHILDNAFCGLGYWWPLWDQKRQTFADKILTTVVLPVDGEIPGAQPFGGQSGFPAPPPSQSFPAQPSPFGQPQAQSGAFGQPQPFGQQPFGRQPQGTATPPSESRTEPGFGESEPTQVLRPGQSQQAPSAFDEAEPTQKLTPEQLRQQLPGADGPNGPGTPQQ